MFFSDIVYIYNIMTIYILDEYDDTDTEPTAAGDGLTVENIRPEPDAKPLPEIIQPDQIQQNKPDHLSKPPKKRYNMKKWPIDKAEHHQQINIYQCAEPTTTGGGIAVENIRPEPDAEPLTEIIQPDQSPQNEPDHLRKPPKKRKPRPEYARRWREANPDYMKLYNIENKERKKELNKLYYIKRVNHLKNINVIEQ